jgi:rod shape determining protein RodA
MNNQRSLFFNVDWFVILTYISLCVFGWFNIHAAVYDPLNPNILDLDTNYGKQLIFIISALIIGFAILLLDSKFFNALSPIFYAITIILLILVLIIGRNVGGNQAWIPIGSFRLQPSEFAKFATCLLLAKYLSSGTIKVQEIRTQLVAALIILVPTVLILFQPDAGSALTFSSLILVLYREGLSGYFLVIEGLSILLFVLTVLYNKYIVLAGILVFAGIIFYFYRKNRKMITVTGFGVLFSILFIFSVDFAYKQILKPHQRNRIDVILGKVNDPRGIGYNLNQSKIAIGSGGIWGKGYLQGTQTKYNFVPEQSTDFIFCTVGEEWGFAGCFFVIGLYLFLLIRIINIAERQRSSFARVYGYGVASILFFHIFINIGMTIGLIPVIGIPLPFLSYGGSSLWSFTILLFILLKFDSNRMGII